MENKIENKSEQKKVQHQKYAKKQGRLSKSEHKFFSWIKSPKSDIVLFVILIVLLNLVGVRAFARFDLTGPKSYSLSQGSKEAVKMIEEPLSVKVFFSANLPAPYSSVDQYVRDLLVEYKNAANKNFSYEYFDMEKPENQKTASSYGLQQIQIQEVKNNEVGLKNAYMGIVFVYADQIEKIDAITSSSGLEYQFTTMINKMVSSANILSGLTGNVKLTLYKSDKLADFNISGFDKIETNVQNAYNTLNKKNMNRIDFEKVNPSTEEVQSLCEKYGIQAINWNNKDGTKGTGTLGLVLEYGGSFRVIPLQMVNMIFSYAISGLDKLEDNLSESLQSLVSRTSKIGYLTGNGELSIGDSQNGAANFSSLLSDIYSLEEMDLLNDDIPSDMQCIIVNGPKTAFDEKALYKLDQFIMRGGNVMFFMDPYDVQQSSNGYYQMPQYIPVRTGLEKLLSKYGVECGTNYVMDEKCYTNLNQNYGKLNFYYAPILSEKSLAKNSPITKNLSSVIFIQTGSLDVQNAMNNSEEKVTVLAKTSPTSWTVTGSNIVLNPMYIEPPADKSTMKAEDIAVLIEGKFLSAFDKAVSSEGEQSSDTEGTDTDSSFTTTNHLAKSTQAGKVFVAASSYLTSPMLISENSNEPIAMFLRNTVDYMNGNSDLCTMRTKGLSLNELEVTTGGFVNFAKYFNQFGLAVIVALVGLIVFLARQAHRKQIRLRYDPSDSREVSKSTKEESK